MSYYSKVRMLAATLIFRAVLQSALAEIAKSTIPAAILCISPFQGFDTYVDILQSAQSFANHLQSI